MALQANVNVRDRPIAARHNYCSALIDLLTRCQMVGCYLIRVSRNSATRCFILWQASRILLPRPVIFGDEQ